MLPFYPTQKPIQPSVWSSTIPVVQNTSGGLLVKLIFKRDDEMIIIPLIRVTDRFYPANIYLFKVNNRNIRKRCKICLMLTIKTLERSNWRRSDDFIVDFEYISRLFVVFLFLTLNKSIFAGYSLWSFKNPTDGHLEKKLICSQIKDDVTYNYVKSI